MSVASLPASPARSRAAIALAASLLATLAGAAMFAAQRWSSAPPPRPPLTNATIGGRALEFDPRLIHGGPQRSGGRLERLDLIVGWADFGPPTLVAREPGGRPAAAPTAAHLLISVQSAAATPDPATRSVAIYGRFVEREVWSNPGGLIVRRFRAGSPYEGEELVMTPDGAEFAARCPIAGTMPSVLPLRCLSAFRTAGLDVTVSFDASLLLHWRRLREGALQLIDGALR